MFKDYACILLDPVLNSVQTRGMGLRYFNQTCTHDVKNLVIIDTRQPIGQFDELTHFNVVRGRDQVQGFLANEARYPNPRVKWIDYKSQELFHQLRAGEIAEILYLAHMNQQLHSPFFYKLQNNYICLPLNDQILKMYYRYINEFYLQFSHLIYDKVQQRPSSRRNFFSLRNDHEDQSLINEPSLKFIRSLEEYFIEGLLLDFSPLAMSNRDQCQIPLYQVEDRILNINKNQAVKIGQLVYDFSQAQWLLEKD